MRIPLSDSDFLFKDLSSSFQAYCGRIEDASEFEEIYQKIRKSNLKAAHIPYAFRVGEYTKSSDDGEPSGTGGKALLGLLDNCEADQTYLIVVRFFGGTKLGIPRLRRAFVSAGEGALSQMKWGIAKELDEYRLEVDYPTYEKLNRICKKRGFLVENEDFSISVKLSLLGNGKIDTVLQEVGIIDIPPSTKVIRIIGEEA